MVSKYELAKAFVYNYDKANRSNDGVKFKNLDNTFKIYWSISGKWRLSVKVGFWNYIDMPEEYQKLLNWMFEKIDKKRSRKICTKERAERDKLLKKVFGGSK